MSEPPSGVRAWDDPATRRAAKKYGWRALGLTALSLPLLLLGAQFVNDNGDTKQGIPGFVPGAFIVAALLALLFGVLSLYNWARIRWTLTRWPWRTMQSHFEEINGFGTPNGQPVLTLDAEGQHRVLTLVAIRYRWRRFRQSELLVCGHPGRGAVIAALDRSSIGWAGRSPLRAFILRLTAFILRRHGKRDEA